MSTPSKYQVVLRPNPNIPADSFGIEDLGMVGSSYRSNILFSDRTYEFVPTSKDGHKFSLKCPSTGKLYWVLEADIDRFLNQGWIPPKVPNANKKPDPRSRVTIRQAVKQSSDTKLRTVTNNSFIRMVGYLLKWFKAPCFKPSGASAATGNLDLNALTMILMSAKSLGQFVAEANGFVQGSIKLPPEFDTSYLDMEKDNPDRPEDTITEIKLRAWYTEMRAKCKAELQQLHFKYGTISKNAYSFFLTNCFPKEFGKTEVTKKSLQVSAKTEAKDKSDKTKVENPALCDVQICFDEEVNSGTTDS